ncbi:hypothetical protein P167DRAFT_543018 [Morchella conica CCBAS932]|uniref:Uncharacterized protein n=1 Tax=Morchella conica CCBAS932 TaxID=1392247 RepID=A0A3N4KY25_9PEZI|nr:hypothetical protein P167DRAFT_543018 [Morchella conica CCBAS932]
MIDTKFTHAIFLDSCIHELSNWSIAARSTYIDVEKSIQACVCLSFYDQISKYMYPMSKVTLNASDYQRNQILGTKHPELYKFCNPSKLFKTVGPVFPTIFAALLIEGGEQLPHIPLPLGREIYHGAPRGPWGSPHSPSCPRVALLLPPCGPGFSLGFQTARSGIKTFSNLLLPPFPPMVRLLRGRTDVSLKESPVRLVLYSAGVWSVKEFVKAPQAYNLSKYPKKHGRRASFDNHLPSIVLHPGVYTCYHFISVSNSASLKSYH